MGVKGQWFSHPVIYFPVEDSQFSQYGVSNSGAVSLLQEYWCFGSDNSAVEGCSGNDKLFSSILGLYCPAVSRTSTPILCPVITTNNVHRHCPMSFRSQRRPSWRPPLSDYIGGGGSCSWKKTKQAFFVERHVVTRVLGASLLMPSHCIMFSGHSDTSCYWEPLC